MVKRKLERANIETRQTILYGRNLVLKKYSEEQFRGNL